MKALHAITTLTALHTTPGGECSEDEEEKERKAAAEAKLSERERIRTSREALPAYAYRQQFLDAVYKHQVLIIVAETGAGKTTQLPQYLLEEGFGKAGARHDDGERPPSNLISTYSIVIALRRGALR